MDLLTALISQTSYIAMLCEEDCNIAVGCKIADEYLGRLAGYTIGVTGIVRHIRIKYKMTYKSIWTFFNDYNLHSFYSNYFAKVHLLSDS